MTNETNEYETREVDKVVLMREAAAAQTRGQVLRATILHRIAKELEREIADQRHNRTKTISTAINGLRLVDEQCDRMRSE
jgi:hypothetical protein